MVLSSLQITAQTHSDITISISKVSSQDIRVSINTKNSTKVLFAMASWGGSEGGYIQEPLSYINLIGNPNTANMLETPKLIISKTVANSEPMRSETYINIDPNASYVLFYKLYGEDWGPLKTFKDVDKSKLKTLQAKLLVNYFDIADEKHHKLEVKSNIITLQ